MTTHHHQQRLGGGTRPLTAEVVVLELCRVLLGDPKRDKRGRRKDYGLMNHIVNGEQHIRSCQIGMYVQAGDSMRGGQPCSDRCQQVHEAIDLAGQYLKAHEAPQQLALGMEERG